MKLRWPDLTRRDLFAGGMVSLAMVALVLERQELAHAFQRFSVANALVILYLVPALIVAYLFPINIRLHTKVHMTSIPLYLLAIFLSPVMAACAAALGIVGGELVVRLKRKNHASNIIMQTARTALFVLLGAQVAHIAPGSGTWRVALMIGAAFTLFAGDILTFSLQQSVLYGDRLWKTIASCLRDVGYTEAIQYAMGLLGALAAAQELWALVILIFPTAEIYLACKRAKETQNSTRILLESMADAVDLRDAYTGGHSRRVTQFTAQILKELGLHGPEVELIVTAARVHDIGKIGIPDEVLNKPGKLTPEEWAIMETHPGRGAELLARYADFARGTDIVRHHHERWDGKGYPDRIACTNIPFGARVIAVADSFDAMTSDRPYRKGMSIAKAASILAENRGIQWDSEIVDAFIHSIAGELREEALECERQESAPQARAGARAGG